MQETLSFLRGVGWADSRGEPPHRHFLWMMSWRRTLQLFAVLAFGVAIRSYRITDHSLWFDEAFSYTLVQKFSWTEMVQRTGYDVHPPLYYVALRIWTTFVGTSAGAMRSLSVVLSSITMGAIYFFCVRYLPSSIGGKTTASFGHEIGIAANVIFSVSSQYIEWSQQVRMYSLGIALAALGAILLLSALKRGSFVSWTCYVLAITAFLYTHNYAILSVFAHLITALIWFARRSVDIPSLGDRGRNVKRAFLSFCAIACLYSPWIPTLMGQVGRVSEDYWIERLTGPLTMSYLARACSEVFIANLTPTAGPTTASCISWGLLIVLSTSIGIAALRCRAETWFLILLVAVPVYASCVLSVFMVKVIVARYFLFAFVFVPVLLALAIWELPKKFRWTTVVVLASSLLWAHVIGINRKPDGPRGVRGAIEYLTLHGIDKPIVVLHPFFYPSVRYYMGDRGVVKLYVSSKGVVPHYTGKPLLNDDDYLVLQDFEEKGIAEAWILTSVGFAAFVPFSTDKAPDGWREVPSTQKVFSEDRFRSVRIALIERTTEQIRRH